MLKNHRGVTEYPKEVQKCLEKEKFHAVILGPFDQVRFTEAFFYFKHSENSSVKLHF